MMQVEPRLPSRLLYSDSDLQPNSSGPAVHFSAEPLQRRYTHLNRRSRTSLEATAFPTGTLNQASTTAFSFQTLLFIMDLMGNDIIASTDSHDPRQTSLSFRFASAPCCDSGAVGTAYDEMVISIAANEAAAHIRLCLTNSSHRASIVAIDPRWEQLSTVLWLVPCISSQ